MANPKLRRPLILALGHPLRRDDGLGLYLLRELEERCSPYADCLAIGQEVLGWLDHLVYRPGLIVLDALDGGHPPGTAIRLARCGERLLETLLSDEAHSHGNNLALALAITRQTGGPMPTIMVYGIQPADITLGEGLTPCVARAANFLIRQFFLDRPWHNPQCLSDAVWSAADQTISERTREKECTV